MDPTSLLTTEERALLRRAGVDPDALIAECMAKDIPYATVSEKLGVHAAQTVDRILLDVIKRKERA